MRSTLTAILVASIVASPAGAGAQVPVIGQAATAPIPPDLPDRGPIARAVAREAARLAVAGQSAGAPAAVGKEPSVGTPITLKWSELSPLIIGQRVEVTLSDGRLVRGEALAVRDTELLLESHGDTEGQATVPRESVVAVKMSRLKGSGGRVFGRVVGVIGGMWLSGYAASTTDSPGVAWTVFVTGTTALGILGHQAGKQADTKVTRITIIP